MTLRALLLGLIGAAFVCAYTYFNDHILQQTMFVGNNMPISVYGLLVFFMMFGFPLIRRLSLARKELATILLLTLIACAIPGSNLLRLFTVSLALPHRYARTEPGWENQKILEYAPEAMFADISEDEELVLNGFTRGLSEGDRSIAISAVPWSAWVRPMVFWIPLILSLWIALMGLALVVHRQWMDHEHLPYPLVTFTMSLLPEEDGSRSPIFKNRLFWIGFLAIFLIHSYNYANVWFDEYLVGAIPLGVNFSSLASLFPNFTAGGGEGFLGDPQYYKIYFTVVAIAYFLPKDVSLSLGVGPFFFFWVTGILATYGIGATGWQGSWPLGISRESTLTMGAFLAMLVVMLYTGRHYYAGVFLRALGLRRDKDSGSEAVWGARVFLVAIACFIVYCRLVVGLDWLLATGYALGCVGIYLVMGRLIAETGLFFVATVGAPVTVLWTVIGARAIGPQGLLLMFLLSIVLFYDTREALMPFVVNALKLADDCRIKPARAVAGGVLALLVGLGVGIPVTLYFQYNHGVDLTAWHSDQPKIPFNDTIGVIQRLEAQGQLEEAGTASGLGMLRQMSLHKQGIGMFTGAALAVFIFSALRLRFANWPLHPVLFLMWTTYPGRCFAMSFLLGWVIKAFIAKYGGATIYQRFKPIMFGVIAGEMLGGLLPMIVSAVYYLSTGKVPLRFGVMPG